MYKKENLIEQKDLHIGCFNCSTATLEAPMDMVIAVGFGSAFVTKDGQEVYNGEKDYRDGKEPKTVGEIEKMAAKESDCDWRIIRHGPMHGETFQRQGNKKWLCIESNGGFS